MKIAITADPEIPIPPLLYGGIERIIDMLIAQYIKKGHEVVLFGHQESITKAKLIPYPSTSSFGIKNILKNTLTVSKLLTSKELKNIDVVHSFGRLAYLTLILPTSIPILMSYQREPTISQIKKAVSLSKKNTLHFSGCSEYIAGKVRPYAPSHAVFNGVPIEIYDYQEKLEDDAPLVFLGRVEHIKGTHIAIEVAQKTGRKLIIAGNIPKDDEDTNYFNSQIKPHLDDTQIIYVGAVNDTQKNEILGKAAAFLMPILWNEPFGIVMAEAMACGTPVIGFGRGSVPEVVKHGINGYICQTLQQMIEAVENIDSISRFEVRKDTENRFSADIISDNYLEIYKKLSA
ncbi:MAG: glycosyltransferase family 4 protein [Flexibacter sp. CG_4_10_14_3_um_filter_32_15]|nr:MAG: glycosyltransferase family 4 protein [Flexibacter sp. CG_4_10_14_3_um_filter_32_15]